MVWFKKKKVKFDFSKDVDLEEMDKVNLVVEKLKEGTTCPTELKLKMDLFLTGIDLKRKFNQAGEMAEVIAKVDKDTLDKGDKLLELYKKGQELNNDRLLKD